MEKNRYLEEIEDLKRQLQRANEQTKYAEEAEELKRKVTPLKKITLTFSLAR